MAMVDLMIAGRSYQVACKDGEEETLRAAGRLVDARSREAVAGLGTLSEARQFLFAALMLADTLVDNRPEAAAPPPLDPAHAERANGFAERLEAIADQLEAEQV
ncbi:MAG: cell division protein ZapA [Sphingomicrobium sp.]